MFWILFSLFSEVWFQILMSCPVRSLVILVDQLLLQITSVDCICLRIEYSWHLEKENFIWACGCSDHLTSVWIKKIWIFKEFSWESAENQNVLVVSLDSTSSLSISEKFLWNLNHFPFVSIGCVILFNWVNVLSSLIGNTAENKDHLVIETTWAMIMSTNIKVWHFKPKINVWVVHLAFYLRLILLFSWSCDNNKLVSKPASWMTMSWMLHRVSLDESKVIMGLDFKERIKSIFILLIVTTTNHVQLSLWSIDTLEVMWERCLIPQSCNFGSLIHKVNGI